MELGEFVEVKNWVMGLILSPAIGLLLWYFKRAQSQTDKRFDDLDADIDGVRTMLARKVEREDLLPVWEKLKTQDQDIKNLGAAFSREMREQIDALRREQKEDQRQIMDRLDRVILIIRNDQQ